MKKQNIIKSSDDFNKILKYKNQFCSKYAYLYIYNNENNYRFGICVSKKIGNAVVRNKYKRRIKDIIDKSGLLFHNKDYIIILKQKVKEASYKELKEDILNLLQTGEKNEKN